MKWNRLAILGAIALVVGLALFFGGAAALGSTNPGVVALAGMAMLIGIPLISFPLAFI